MCPALQVLLGAYEQRQFQRDIINEMPLYPTEGTLWDEAQIPSATFTGETCLALPKLNLQACCLRSPPPCVGHCGAMLNAFGLVCNAR